MSEQKKPQAGEWWEHPETGIRYYCIGLSDDGFEVVCMRDRIPFRPAFNWSNYRHMPLCTGWDWKPEDEWPKYFINAKAIWSPDAAFVVFSDADCTATMTRTNGSVDTCGGWTFSEALSFVRSKLWKQITEAEAKSRLTDISKCPDCGEFRGHGHEDVCPMAWITQDRVEPRMNVDQVRWSNWQTDTWVNPVGSWTGEKHGFRDEEDDSILYVRCRRKDLPPLPVSDAETQNSDPLNWPHSEQKKRTTVRLFVSYETLSVYAVQSDKCGESYMDKEIKHDGQRFYVEED